MLQVLPVFLYMGLTCWITGYGVLTFFSFRSFCRKENSSGDTFVGCLSCLLAGAVFVTVYAQIFSLFHGVGLIANLFLCVICAAIALCCRSGLREQVTKLIRAVHSEQLVWLLYVALILLMAYGTSHGIMHYDTGLYHAQSIRFLEEYGVVKGLANLHTRLGYNSACFAFSALYSFYFAGGASLHAGAGFFSLLLSFACLDLRKIVRRGRPVSADFVRFAGLYYLFNIFKEMVSPAPDYFLNCVLFLLLIYWLELDERGERRIFPYALLTAGFCFAITIKLSAAPLILLSAGPIARIIREERDGGKVRTALFRIATWICVCLGVTLPWLIRNLLISGWLLYPSTVPSVCTFSWQVPRDLAEGDAAGIRAWARGVPMPSVGLPAQSFIEWFPVWFGAQSMVSRALLIVDFCLAAGFLVWLILLAFPAFRRYRENAFLFPEGVLLLSFLFWFLESPLIRYGFFFVWAPPALILGRLLLRIAGRFTDTALRRFAAGIMAFLTVFVIYKGVRLVMTDTGLMHPVYMLKQQEYERFEVLPYEVDGVTFYYPAEGDQTGYDAFPAGDHRAKIRLLGENLREGIASAE